VGAGWCCGFKRGMGEIMGSGGPVRKVRFKVDNGMMRFVIILQMIGVTVAFGASKAPYPKSDRISGIVFERETLERRAEGSDIWSCAWGGNGEIYATYGDGGGFGGSDSKGRVSIGVAELKGEPPNWAGINLWGGLEPKSAQAATEGKGTITAVDELLYLFVSEQGKWNRCRLWRSGDYGMSWKDKGWVFPESHKEFAFPAIIEFGKGQSLNKDGFIYGISDNSPYRGDDKKLYLFRVKRGDIERLDRYEYFSGNEAQPEWTKEYTGKKPIFKNEEGISWGTTCVYHPATGLFLLSAGIEEKDGSWGLYESEHPWGPWRTIAYGAEMPEWTFTPAEKNRPAYLHTFPSKWMSADGKRMWCVFDRGDQLNVARCRLEIKR
jgi:hypothetical protein